jgi:hypothetical protein
VHGRQYRLAYCEAHEVLIAWEEPLAHKIRHPFCDSGCVRGGTETPPATAHHHC